MVHFKKVTSASFSAWNNTLASYGISFDITELHLYTPVVQTPRRKVPQYV